MSWDTAELDQRASSLRPVTSLEPGMFDNFMLGTAKYTMQGFAKAGRAIDMVGAVGPIVQDALASNRVTTTTEAQDRYFREHDETFKRAVDYWTPAPNETGTAAQVVGSLLGTLPFVIASPGLAVGATQVSSALDLQDKGVGTGRAQAVGAVQAVGLATGIWMPVLGRTGFERVVLGGAGFNAAQGIATRGVSGALLHGTAAADDFKAFDGHALTLDVLLGAAFGGLAHLSPAQRKQGADMWDKIAGTLKPSEIDAIATLRQAQHLSEDSAPGKLSTPAEIDAHAQRMRKAIDDLVHDRPVNVEDLPPVTFADDAARTKFQTGMAAHLQEQARAAILAGADAASRADEARALPGFLRTAEDQLALRDPAKASPEIARAIEIANKPGFERTATEKVFLEAMLNGKAGEYLRLPNSVFPVEQLHSVLKAEKIELTSEHVAAVDLIAQARAIDAAAVDVLGESLPTAQYLKKMKEIIGDHASTTGAARSPDTGGQALRNQGPEATGRDQPGSAGRGTAEAPGRETGGSQSTGQADRPVDPALVEASRFADENPHVQLTTGLNPDGSPMVVNAREYLDDAAGIVEQAREDASLFEVAAQCILGAQ